MTDNVIMFPGVKRDAPPQTIEEIADKVTQTRRDHVEVVMHELIPDLIHVFSSYGIDINSDEYIKDIAMVVESIKALMDRQYNLHHPFHEMIDNVFSVVDQDEEGSITYAYKFTDASIEDEKE